MWIVMSGEIGRRGRKRGAGGAFRDPHLMSVCINLLVLYLNIFIRSLQF